MPRPKGSTSKNKQFLLNRLQDMYGEDFHPIMKMAGNAVKLQEVADEAEAKPSDLVTASKAWGDIAEYTEPKLKSIEHKGNALEGASFVVKYGK